MTVALDATYSVGDSLSGVGIYSREMLFGLARAHPEEQFRFCYRPHRLLRSFSEPLPRNTRRALLGDSWVPGARVFHGLNQRLPRKRPRCAVSTFHDLFVLTGEYSSPEFRRRFADQARHAADNSDLIIAVSAFTASQVHDLLGVERERVRVVHHGIRPLPLPTLARERVVLNVGALQARKNIVPLVDAFAALGPEWRLVIAGSRGYGADEPLRRIEESPCRDRIRLLGYIPAAELAAWYARASLFVFPSLDEGFGMPVLEAMAAGVPVIASGRAALPEVAGDAALLVDAANSQALADAMQSLANNAELSSELARRGHERAAGFSWNRAVEATWRIYDELGMKNG